MELFTKVKKVFGPEYNGIDYSSHHDMIIVDDDGTCRPMDENYFEATLIAPGLWKILTFGDYIYLVEGENEAIVVDTGYGIGDLRKMCQTLTDKPIRDCIITHEHYDHIVGGQYFDHAYMTATCADQIMNNRRAHGPMFEGIDVDWNYNKTIVEEGHIFDLGGRQLEVFIGSDHAPGGLMLLDKKNHVLISGDELGTPAYKAINTTVENYARGVFKLYKYIDDIEMIVGGGFCFDDNLLFRQKHCLELILHGQPGVDFIPPTDLIPGLKNPLPEGVIADGRRFHIEMNMHNPLKRHTGWKIMTFGYSSMIYRGDHIFDEK